MPDESPPTRLESLAQLFARHGVEFLVIGGQAEYLFGSPRVTYDVDFCYRRTRDNLEKLAAALKELKPTLRGAPADLPLLLDARALALGNNYTFQTAYGDVDLLGTVEPIGDYDALVQHAETHRVGSLDLKTISLDDLIKVKEHIRRPKDRDSLFQLQAIQRLRNETGLK